VGLKLRYSVHTLPWLLDFKQKIASLPVLPGSGTGSVGLFTTAGSASVAVNLAKFDRLDEVIADDEGSLIRLHDGDTIIDEWIAKRGSRAIDTNTKTHELIGKPLPSIFDHYLVPAFDSPNNPAVDPNWAWGGGAAGIDGGNLLKNASYERLAFPNGGFEDGNASPWQARNGANMFAVLNAANARTGSWHGEITSIGAAGDGAECTISGLYPGKTYTVTIYGEDTTAAGDRYRCGITDAIDPTHTNAYTGTDGTIYAEIDNATQGNGSSDGTYQSFILSFTAVGDSIQIFIEAPDGAAADLKLDDCDIAGYGVGLSPEWIPLYGPYRENTFEIDKTWSTDGDQSLKWQGDDSLYTNPYTGAQAYGRTGVEQRPPLLDVGATYTFGVTVKHDSLSSERVVLILQRVTPLGEVGSPGSSYMISKNFDIASAATDTLELTGVADVSDVRWELRWKYQGAFDENFHPSPNINQDNAYLYKGLPPAKPGDILAQLLDAHTTLGTWIDYSSFSATLDSNGVAWPEDIAFEVQWGEHYGHVLDRLVDIGYEWELVPKTTPVGNLTHDLHLYNTGGRDSSPSRAINKGQSVLAGEVINRIPDYTSVLLEGAGGAWSKVTDATTETDFGVLEKYVANRQLLNETTRDLGADAFLAYEAANRAAVRLTLAATLKHPRPLVDYRPGDTIPFQIPPTLPKEDRRVQRIDYTNTFPTRYVVTGSRVLDGDAAAFDLLWRLWRRFTRPQPTTAGGTGTGDKGGHFTIQVAAVDASGESQAKADPGFLCIGVNDHAVIMDAMLICWSAGGGEVWLSEGTFSCDPDEIVVGYSQSYPEPITLHGASNGGTVIQLTGAETDWGVLVTDVGRMVDIKVNGPLGG
jgi:hypothetical protein